MDYYLSDTKQFKVSSDIGLDDPTIRSRLIVVGFVLVSRAEYNRARRSRAAAKAWEYKRRCAYSAKMAAIKVKYVAVTIKNKTNAAVGAFKK